MEQRTTKLTILLGFNGTGKSTMLKNILDSMLANGHRALIVTPDSIEWTDVEETLLNKKSDYLFTGIRRHIFNPRTTLDALQHFKKGVLVFDDCRAYFKDSTDDRVRELLIRRRQKELDIFAVGHGFTQVPPVFFTFASHYILFKTVDNIDRRKNCINANFDFIKESQAFVNEQAKLNPHFYRIIEN